ncbi:MAG: glycosyltransferase [Coriobacteriia bacterium]|nr:glycosyltransferase [Coriobacteriia bacterium]
MPQVSVVMPAYNTSAYLRKCLDSVLAQTLDDFELIVVDDGSTDSTVDIVREYAARDGRIRLVQQQNQGAGVARNTGLAQAQGEYLIFWDSDDWFDKRALEKLYARAKRDDADLCLCDARAYLVDKGVEHPLGYLYKDALPKPDERPFSAKSHPDTILNMTTSVVWNKLMRVAFLRDAGLCFAAQHNGETVQFVMSALCLAERITYVDEELITYRQGREGSIVTQVNKNVMETIQGWIATRELLEERGCLPERSYDNKALDSIIYQLRLVTDYDVYVHAVTYLKEEGLERMGLRPRPAGYYHHPGSADTLQHLIDDDVNHFLMYQSTKAYKLYREGVFARRTLRDQVKDLKKQNKRLRNTLPRKVARKVKGLLGGGSKNGAKKSSGAAKLPAPQDRLLARMEKLYAESDLSAVRAHLEGMTDAQILAERGMERHQLLLLLALKHGQDFDWALRQVKVQGDATYWTFGGTKVRLRASKWERTVRLEFITDEGDGLLVEGWLQALQPLDLLGLQVTCADGVRAVELRERPDVTCTSPLREDYLRRPGFAVKVPYGDFSFQMGFAGPAGAMEPALLEAGDFCPLGFAADDYAVLPTPQGAGLAGAWTLTPGQVGQVCCAQRDLAWVLEQEAAVQARLAADPKTAEFVSLRDHAVRTRFGVDGAGEGEPRVWLISDRIVLAGDNGEALFAYLHEHPEPGVEPVFALSEDSVDFERMAKLGRVVAYGSPEYQRLMVTAELIVSSAGDRYVTNVFPTAAAAAQRGLVRPKFAFLQHGITKDDMSWWLKRTRKDIRLLVTASEREQASFTENPRYGYGADVVKCTGFPRHDELLRQSAEVPAGRKVLIAPTWRSYLTGVMDAKTGQRAANPDFEQSAYFRFYDQLLHDEQVAAAVAELGYEVEFLIHPAFVQEAGKFSSSYARVSTEYEYRRLFLESSIMVTDFSSVFFDFALLRKPVLYAQFDEDEFFGRHYVPGYFRYREDGFGPVLNDYEQIRDQLLAYLRQPVMEPEYAARADAFFYEPATSRCQEVVEALRAL